MKQIIAMGGGGFSMEPDNLLLDRYVLAQVSKEMPEVCFVPTASGDADGYVERFYHAFRTLPCIPSHLSLFQPNFADLRSFVLEKDIIYVGGAIPGICWSCGRNGAWIRYSKRRMNRVSF